MRAFHFLSKSHALLALENQRLKVSTINELNDPFELLACDLGEQATRQGFRAWKNQTAKNTGLLCFSRDWKNPLLWSHYADRHRGVALQFELHGEVAVPVRYAKRRIRLDSTRIMANGGFSEDLAMKIATTKSEHWSYEEEIRVAVSLKDCDRDGQLYFERLSKAVRITGLVVGPLSKLTAECVRSRLPRGHQIKVWWARQAFTKFDIVRDKSKTTSVITSAT